MYDTVKAAEAQQQFCEAHGYPFFAPGPSGHCYHCGKDIYSPHQWPDGHTSGITVEGAGKTLITGCPHCHYSFCD